VRRQDDPAAARSQAPQATQDPRCAARNNDDRAHPQRDLEARQGGVMATRRKKPVTVEEAGISVRLFRRGRQWWADVRVSGERTRVSLETAAKATAEGNARALAQEIARQNLLGVKADTLTLSAL